MFLFFCLSATLNAQEMQPRAYLPAPVGINFFGIGYSHHTGGLLFDPSLPVEDAHVVANTGTFFETSFSYDLPHNWYLVTAPTINADWTQSRGDRWLVPIGGGIGRTLTVANQALDWNVALSDH